MLKDPEVRKARFDGKPWKLFDRKGLFLHILAREKVWRVRFRIWSPQKGRPVEKLLTLGPYPRISLGEARRQRDDALEKVAAGIDPAAEKQAAKRPSAGEKTFETAAREWHAAQLSGWKPVYAGQVWGRIENDLLPDLGTIAIASLTRADVLKALRRVEARGAHDVARKCRQHVAGILRHAGASDERVTDFTPMLRGGLKPPPRVRHFRTLLGEDFGDVVFAIDRYEGDLTTKLALQLALLTVVRTSEIRGATWREFEATRKPGEGLWRIPPERMKAVREHLVPLSTQAIAILEKLRTITGAHDLLFPGERGEGMSENTMLFALYRMGFHSRQTVHGFRRAFSSWANESGWNPDAVERTLAHDEGDVRSIYNAAQYLKERRRLLQAWADYLDTIKEKAHVRALIG